MGSSYITEGAQLGALWWPRGVGWGWEGSSNGKGYKYTYSWFMLYIINKHNTVKQLSSN